MDNTKVIDSRTMDEGSAIRRRRQCEACSERFTTYERVDMIPLTVVKRDRTREGFDRSKVLDGIIKSCNKRSISVKEMEDIVTQIESAISNSLAREIESCEIGDMVMDKLREIDEVAYVRFASVYKRFTDIDTFMAELSELLHDKK
jgi:transcriptional repressor NrdR